MRAAPIARAALERSHAATDRETLSRLDFHKYSALGNDYLVLDPQIVALPTPERARQLCDRHNGLGADGIIYGPIMNADGRMAIRIFNPDGSEAEKSRNGIRIFARYAFEAGYVGRAPFTLVTRGGDVTVRVLDGAAALIAVDMGAPSFRSGDLPMTGPDREVVNAPLVVDGQTVTVTCVSMGNPHCVIRGGDSDFDEAEVRRLGPLIETAPDFPQRTNVQFGRVLSRAAIAIQIWERGAGYALSSGSSGCAAASAARRLGLVDDAVTVHMPGGDLSVTFQPDGHALLTGPVTGVMRGYFHPVRAG
jgi:diaminopimelate epimerase